MVRLLPEDEAYFTLLERLGGHLTAALSSAQDAFTNPASATGVLVVVRAEEHAADAVAREIVTRLDRTFVTPFDRDDIHAVTLHLDGVVDLAEDAAESVVTLHVDRPDPAAAELAAVLLRAGNALAHAVGELRRPAGLLAAAQKVRGLEKEGDAVYMRAMTALFADPPDPWMSSAERRCTAPWRRRWTSASASSPRCRVSRCSTGEMIPPVPRAFPQRQATSP